MLYTFCHAGSQPGNSKRWSVPQVVFLIGHQAERTRDDPRDCGSNPGLGDGGGGQLHCERGHGHQLAGGDVPAGAEHRVL